jgi:hypothetical protein
MKRRRRRVGFRIFFIDLARSRNPTFLGAPYPL